MLIFMVKGESKFLRIQCPRCRHVQIIFGKSATRVKCAKCNKLLVGVTGGKVRVKALVQEVLK